MAKKLTGVVIGRLRPAGVRREVKDERTAGLHLVIHPSGQRSWVMRFRRPSGKQAKLTLGTFAEEETADTPVLGGQLTLAGARQLATEVNRKRALGQDPAAEFIVEKRKRRAEARQAAKNTFGAATQAYVQQRAKERTKVEVARLLGLVIADDGELKVVPGGLTERWFDRPVTEISTDDVDALIEECRHDGVPGTKRLSKRITESRARAMFSVLSRLFNWLRATRKNNPCRGAERPATPKARERVLSDDEVRWFWKACDQIGQPFGHLFHLLLVTGQRRQEVGAMNVSELSKDRTAWVLPPERTKNKRTHTVFLSPLAQEILASANPGKSGFIFSTTGHTPVSGYSKVKHRLDVLMRPMAKAEGSTFKEWRLHDLRRTMVSGAARAGADLHVIERAINHVSGSFGGIVGVYQKHRFEEEVRKAFEAWADLLTSIVRGPASGKVVKLRGRVR